MVILMAKENGIAKTVILLTKANGKMESRMAKENGIIKTVT
jgi:hypothetical protein